MQEEVFDLASFRLHGVSRPGDAAGFVHLPQRGVAERTVAWLGRSRLSRDGVRLPESRAALLQVRRI